MFQEVTFLGITSIKTLLCEFVFLRVHRLPVVAPTVRLFFLMQLNPFSNLICKMMCSLEREGWHPSLFILYILNMHISIMFIA